MRNPFMLYREWSESDPFAAVVSGALTALTADTDPEPDRPGSDDQFEWWLNEQRDAPHCCQAGSPCHLCGISRHRKELRP